MLLEQYPQGIFIMEQSQMDEADLSKEFLDIVAGIPHLRDWKVEDFVGLLDDEMEGPKVLGFQGVSLRLKGRLRTLRNQYLALTQNVAGVQFILNYFCCRYCFPSLIMTD